MSNFKKELNDRFCNYKKIFLQSEPNLFERQFAPDGRPPVFTRNEAWRNVLIDPDSRKRETEKLLALIPNGERHKWFGSMTSSQALAQSVLGNLAIDNSLQLLSDLNSDEGLPLLGKARISSESFSMEHKIDFLDEPRQTSLDGYFSGDYQIAIECKFTEPEVGTCSRPGIKPTMSNYDKELCNGDYSRQRSRIERCSLTKIGVAYWRYIPSLFKWENNKDLSPCPIKRNYQLVRNILSIGVNPDKTISLNHGHVILIYDERNPSCQPGGDIFAAYLETRNALLETKMLRKISWQTVVKQMREKEVLSWLTEQLDCKYGL